MSTCLTVTVNFVFTYQLLFTVGICLPRYPYLITAYRNARAVDKTSWNVFSTKWHQNRDLSLIIRVPETSSHSASFQISGAFCKYQGKPPRTPTIERRSISVKMHCKSSCARSLRQANLAYRKQTLYLYYRGLTVIKSTNKCRLP